MYKLTYYYRIHQKDEFVHLNIYVIAKPKRAIYVL